METFMSGLIRMSGRGILILLVVFFVRFLMKKLRVSHKYIMGLWAMAFFFFLFPWKISLPFGFWNHADTAAEEQDAGDGLIPGDPWTENGTEGDMDSAVWDVDPAELVWKVPMQIPSKENRNNGASQTGQSWLFGVKDSGPEKSGILHVAGIVWLTGFCLLLGRLFYSYFSLKRKLRFSVSCQDNIWWTEETNIPMVFGLFHPQIYLPLFMQKEDPGCVIAHENMHIKRKDALFKMLVYIVCVIHWLNPFVWIAYVLFGGDMEKACDEEVIQGMGKEQRKVYAYTLLRMAEESAAYRKNIFAAPVCFDEGDVGSRIKNIMKYKKTLRGLGIAAVVLIVGLCALFLTEAKEDGKEDQQETEQIGTDENGEGVNESGEGMGSAAPDGGTQKDVAGEGETQDGGTTDGSLEDLPYNGPVEEGRPENNGQPYGKPVNFNRDSMPADFVKAIENFSYDGTFPDGHQYGIIPEKFSYAVYDVDGDGKDEFILRFSDTFMAGMIEEVYAYEDGVFREELAEFPVVTYYDNGVIQADWSHNQGNAGDRFLWPYNVYRYQPETDSYELAGSVDGWDREIADSIYEIGQFPDGTDADGDGFVYLLQPPDWEGQYDNVDIVDRSDYEKWREQFFGGANALEIPYQEVEVETVYPAAQG